MVLELKKEDINYSKTKKPKDNREFSLVRNIHQIENYEKMLMNILRSMLD